MKVLIVIPGRFASLNQFIDANRRSSGKWNGGNAMKKKDQAFIRQYLPPVKFKKRVFITYYFYEKDTRRDMDNVSGYFHKVFQDALVQSGIIDNDGWKNIRGMADYFYTDSKHPRIEIEIAEEK